MALAVAPTRQQLVLTQKIDRLHQTAGSERVIDLYGRLDTVRCTGCGQKNPREEHQGALARLNTGWLDRDGINALDGDAIFTLLITRHSRSRPCGL